MMAQFVALAFKFFFLFTPFFALSMFLAMTAEKDEAERRVLAHRVAFATIVIAGLLLFFGQVIFDLFGITVDAFRIGAGILLLLTAISLMNPKVVATKEGEDISVVPLAMPVIVGPASCGARGCMSGSTASAIPVVKPPAPPMLRGNATTRVSMAVRAAKRRATVSAPSVLALSMMIRRSGWRVCRSMPARHSASRSSRL